MHFNVWLCRCAAAGLCFSCWVVGCDNLAGLCNGRGETPRQQIEREQRALAHARGELGPNGKPLTGFDHMSNLLWQYNRSDEATGVQRTVLKVRIINPPRETGSAGKAIARYKEESVKGKEPVVAVVREDTLH